MNHKRRIVLLVILVIIFSVTIPVLDAYVFQNEGFESLGIGVVSLLLMVVMPFAVILTLLYSIVRVIHNLASSRVSTNEKNGVLRRILIVIIVSLTATGLLAALNAAGTILIDI